MYNFDDVRFGERYQRGGAQDTQIRVTYNKDWGPSCSTGHENHRVFCSTA